MHDLTDSYCERCGARYVFRTTPPKGPSLKNARVLAKGLKNFVLTDGQSMADAMTLARQEDEREDATRATEMFHRTFNFCMICRQYACDRCWNAEQGACLSCAPSSEHLPSLHEDRLIVRTPVARHDGDWSAAVDFEEMSRASAPAGAEPMAEPEWPPAPNWSPKPATPDWPAEDLTSQGQAPTYRVEAERPVPSPRQPDWSLWSARAGSAEPWEDPRVAALTPAELDLVEDQLEHRGAHESPDLTPLPRVAESTQPPQPPAGGLPIGSVPTPSDHPHVSIVGRLLGHHAAEQAPTAPAAEDGSQRPDAHTAERSPGSWPQPTPWNVRPVDRRDWGTGAVDAAAAESITHTSEQQPEAVEPVLQAVAAMAYDQAVEQRTAPLQSPEPTLPQANEPELQSTLDTAGQQRLFDLASAAKERGIVPTPATPVSSAGVERGRYEAPAPRQETSVPRPMGATWPAVDKPAVTWPTRPSVEAPPAAVLAARQTAQPNAAAVWAASAQEVLNRGGGRACYHCALPVSTHARFCRRCGTQQI